VALPRLQNLADLRTISRSAHPTPVSTPLPRPASLAVLLRRSPSRTGGHQPLCRTKRSDGNGRRFRCSSQPWRWRPNGDGSKNLRLVVRTRRKSRSEHLDGRSVPRTVTSTNAGFDHSPGSRTPSSLRLLPGGWAWLRLTCGQRRAADDAAGREVPLTRAEPIRYQAHGVACSGA